jgi:hypothetical protein
LFSKPNANQTKPQSVRTCFLLYSHSPANKSHNDELLSLNSFSYTSSSVEEGRKITINIVSMSDLNSDSSPEEGASFMKGKEAWNHDMRGVFAELNRLRESLVEKDKEINRLHRETHKLKVHQNFETSNTKMLKNN